jgi:hypothetical protein
LVRSYVTNGSWLLGAVLVVEGIALAVWQSPLFIPLVPLGIWIAARSGAGHPSEPPPTHQPPRIATSGPDVASPQPHLRPWFKVVIYRVAVAGAIFCLYAIVATILFVTSDFTF